MSTEANSVLDALQDAVAAELGLMAGLRGVQIVTRRTGVLEHEIKERVESLGICVVVFPPDGEIQNPDIAGPFFDRVIFEIAAYERPVINRERGATRDCTALGCAEVALWALHHWQPPIDGANKLYAMPGTNPKSEDDAGVAVSTCFLVTSFGLEPRSS